MEKISVTINDIKVETTAGRTILDVVNENKLDHIPTLCNDSRIEPYGSCFICVVEVVGINRLVPACATPVSDGMVIHTNNEKIRSSRKTALELLMSNHYADCVGPCVNNCPAGVDAQGYIALIALGKHEEALKLIKQNNPLPLSIGRVCVRKCEDGCRRCFVDDAVAVNHLKRYVADKNNNSWKPELKKRNGKKVAVVGGGPAGLTCAYYLTIEGYSVKIFEKLPELGGMLKYGIPEYRLPKEILDSEIKWITDLGVDVQTGAEMGKDFTLGDLKKDGYNSIYLSVGAHKASAMRLDGEEVIKGIYKGIDFLREVEINGAPAMKGTAVIVGGGNTAIDAARTALRCGAEHVKIVYRRSLNEMPAHHAEITAAQEEGVEILFLTNPKSIVAENGKLTSVECLKMKLEAAGPGERPKPVEVPGSEYMISCDYLISAIGQQIDISFISREKDCKTEKWGTVIVNKNTFETSIPGVFAGGDVVNGPLTAVSAIGQGKKAAEAIDEYSQTGKATGGKSKYYSFKNRFGDLSENEFSHFKKLTREKMPELPLNERKNNFKEVELGLDTARIAAEAQRCLECGCSEYYDCSLRKYADEYNIDITNYIGDIRKFKIDRSHPLIAFDPNKCINCGKCVRTCSEILDVSALGFVYRGFKAIAKPSMEKPLLETNCVACGNCIDVCPTGAISENLPFKVLGTMPKTNHRTICNFCSVGCHVNMKLIDNDIYYASNSTPEIINSPNNGYLCVKGRFGYRSLFDKNKTVQPLVKMNGAFSETGIEKAIEISAKRIKEIIEKYGPDSVAVFGSPKLTNEELYLLQKFARSGLKTNNIASFSHLAQDSEKGSLDNSFGATASTVAIEDLQKADVIVVINANLTSENLVMEMKVRQACRKGAKLILVSSAETNLAGYADLWVDSRKGTNTLLLNGVIHQLIDKKNTALAGLSDFVNPFDPETVTELTDVNISTYNELIRLLGNANDNIIFVYNIDSPKDRSANDLKAIHNLLAATGRIRKENNGIIILRDHANSQGALDMGVSPQYLPGYVKWNEKDEISRISKAWNSDLDAVFSPSDILQNLNRDKIKAVLIFGEDPLSDAENVKYFNNIEFMLVMDAYNTDTAKEADVFIPASTFIQQQGTYTACDTRIQRAEAAVKRNDGNENWKIISKLAGHFGNNFNFDKPEAIDSEIQLVNRIYKGYKPGDHWNRNNAYFNADDKFLFYQYKIDMTALSPAKADIHYTENHFAKHIRNRLTALTGIYG